MSVFRRQHNSNFTTISNRLFDDVRLAADEVGILAFLISRPKDWEVRRPALMRRWGIGIVAMKRIVNSWMRTGWCQAAKVRLPNGQFYIEYRIFDLPGREMTDDEIREALSLVSSEASTDDAPPISSGDGPESTAEPPPCDPLLVDQTVATEGWPIRDIPNNELPRTDSNQKFEREGAKLREKHALNLIEFKRRWPTNVSDDQARVDNAWFDLSSEEGEAALAGIAPFLDHLKRNHRKHPPAGFTYLGQKRWTLMEQTAPASATPSQFERTSPEAKAIAVLFDVAGKVDFFHKAVLRSGVVNWRIEINPQLLALADVGQRSAWRELSHQQAGAWNAFIGDRAGLGARRLVAGSLAPKPWPPRKDGTWPPEGQPEPTDEDFNALASEGQSR